MAPYDKPKLTCATVAGWDLANWLRSIGIVPVQVRTNGHYWYRSPFRPDERTPSFRVDTHRQQWTDWGTGARGGLLEFGMSYYQLSLSELLARLSGSELPEPAIIVYPSPARAPAITVTAVGEFQDQRLLGYAAERGIVPDLLKDACRQVHFKLAERMDKGYTAIGFANNKGGHELRNRFYKGASAPKWFTHIKRGGSTVHVFEGFFDHLSWLSLADLYSPDGDLLILNSLALWPSAAPLLESYGEKNLWLDNDPAADRLIRALPPHQGYTDRRASYTGFKDLNDLLLGSPITI